MLSIVTPSAGALIREVRQDAQLSLRGLAERAGVAYSTIARIESGRVDPTTGMLARILAAAGFELNLGRRPAPVPELAGLVDAWRTGPNGEATPDWTRLRALLDYLALHPVVKRSATRRQPSPSGSALLDNLLAAMAEKTCDDGGLARPAWTDRVAPLGDWWSQPGTPRMRDAARASTPPQLLARHVILATGSLWRDPATVGA
jgi:transcriptional regulator with XRE-family HTH domain